jgi:integrase
VSLAQQDFKYLFRDKDRRGNWRVYARVARRKIRIREPEGTPAFAAAYAVAVEALKAGGAAPRGKEIDRAAPGSLGWLAAEYFASAKFKAMAARSPKSAKTRRGVIEGCLREPLTVGGKMIMRDCPYKRFDATHMMMLRDRKAKADLPGAANNRLKYFSSFFGWAIEAKKYGLGVNPVRDAKAIQYATGGFHTWTRDDVAAYEKRHPLGTKARLAMALLLYLGARRQDMIRLGPKNKHGGVMSYVPKKTTYKRVEESHKPILPPLADALAATPTGINTFLVNDYGKPFADAGMGNKMREWCDQAGLPECTAHGLKKIAATLCAEAGATDRQMMALFDWTSERQANTYTEAASRRRMAAEAGKILGDAMAAGDGTDAEQIDSQKVTHSSPK